MASVYEREIKISDKFLNQICFAYGRDFRGVGLFLLNPIAYAMKRDIEFPKQISWTAQILLN